MDDIDKELQKRTNTRFYLKTWKHLFTLWAQSSGEMKAENIQPQKAKDKL